MASLKDFVSLKCSSPSTSHKCHPSTDESSVNHRPISSSILSSSIESSSSLNFCMAHLPTDPKLAPFFGKPRVLVESPTEPIADLVIHLGISISRMENCHFQGFHWILHVQSQICMCIWCMYIYIYKYMYTIKYPYVPPHYSKDHLYPHHIPIETLEIPIN